MTPKTSYRIFDNAAPFKIDGVYCKLIPLTQGQHAIVDANDYERLIQLKWYALWNSEIYSYYAVRNGKKIEGYGKFIQMHRYIMGFDRDDKRKVDHFNKVTLDNRQDNLRPANNGQNMQNRGKQKNNTSGYKGVTWHSVGKKWQAQIAANDKHKYLGLFDTPEAAYAAYCVAAKEMHGEFVNTGEQ